MLATVIAPIKAPGFAQNTSTTTSNSTSSRTNTNTVKNLRIGYFPNINHAQAVIGLGNQIFRKH